MSLGLARFSSLLGKMTLLVEEITILPDFEIRLEDYRDLLREYANTSEIVSAGCLSEESLNSELNDPLVKYSPDIGGAIFIASVGSAVAGMVCLAGSTEDLPIAEVKRLYVRPDHRRHKVASALMDHLLKWECARSSPRKLEWHTLPQWTGAVAFYRRHRYTEVPAAGPNPLGAIFFEHVIEED